MKLNMIIGSLVLGATLSTPSFGGGLLDRMLGLKGSGCDSACCDTGCSADPTCGCEIADPSCGCESACGGGCASACEPTCGCESACDPCGAAPTCGCEIAACDPCGAAPSCGCEIAACDPCGCDSGCGKARRRPLMELLAKLRSKKSSCCDSGCASACEPTCGCETADACGCGAAPTCGCEIAACDPCGAAPSCGCEIAACDSGCGCGSKKKCGGLLSKLFKKRGNSCCDAIACDSGCASAPCGCSSAAPVAAPAVNGEAAPMPPAPVVDPSAYLQSNRRVIQATGYVR